MARNNRLRCILTPSTTCDGVIYCLRKPCAYARWGARESEIIHSHPWPRMQRAPLHCLPHRVLWTAAAGRALALTLWYCLDWHLAGMQTAGVRASVLLSVKVRIQYTGVSLCSVRGTVRGTVCGIRVYVCWLRITFGKFREHVATAADFMYGGRSSRTQTLDF